MNGTVTTLTNTYGPEETTVFVRKVWDDKNNQDGKRPEALTVKLLANGEETDKSVTLNAANKWEAKIEKLPKFEDGVEIVYSWAEDETGLPEGYTLTNTEKVGTITTLTNSYTTEETEIEVTKAWNDADDQDGKRPEQIVVTLTGTIPGAAEGESKTVFSDTQTIKPETKDGQWSYKWTKLDVYAEGKKIDYAVTEAKIDEYTTSIGEITPVVVNEVITGYTVTITNTHITEKTYVTVTKNWDDSEGKEGFRPDKVTVQLWKNTEAIDSVELNEGNHWTHAWSGLAKFDNGTKIIYTVTEEQVPGYSAPVIKKVSATEFEYTVTNSREYEETEATVKKVWNDSNNQDGKRPTELKVTLSNGTEVTLTAANNWTATIEHLPKYANGVEIEYTWTEDTEGLPEGYELTSSNKVGTITTLTNSYETEETEATVKKVWNDSEVRERC